MYISGFESLFEQLHTVIHEAGAVLFPAQRIAQSKEYDDEVSQQLAACVERLGRSLSHCIALEIAQEDSQERVAHELQLQQQMAELARDTYPDPSSLRKQLVLQAAMDPSEEHRSALQQALIRDISALRADQTACDEAVAAWVRTHEEA